MSSWPNDIADMHEKFCVTKWVNEASFHKQSELLKLRMRMLLEEFQETMDAYLQEDKQEFVDGLVDLCVIAIGTMQIAGVDPQEAWDEVLHANKSKEVGIKEGRPNKLGLPDLIKPYDWEEPLHVDNFGKLKHLFKSDWETLS